MKTALITGAAGFVGRHMTQHLEDKGWDVAGIDTQWSTPVFDYLRSNRAVYDLVVHAAAQAPHRTGIDLDRNAFAVNVGLDAAVFDWAIRTAQRRVVYLSSSAVYPAIEQSTTIHRRLVEDLVDVDNAQVRQPFDDYGWTKILGERLATAARRANVSVTVVRPFSGYGADQSQWFPFGAFRDRVRRREKPFTIWGSAYQVRDWIHIDDICAGIMALVDDDVDVPVNLCTGRGITMRHLAELMLRCTEHDAEIHVDVDAPLGVMHRVGDTTRFFTHYRPKVSLEEGILRTLKENR